MTAVEWYADQHSQLLIKLLKNELENENEYPNMARNIKSEALEMERKQIIDACHKMQIINDVDYCGNVTFIFSPEDYYNETFGGAGEPGR